MYFGCSDILNESEATVSTRCNIFSYTYILFSKFNKGYFFNAKHYFHQRYTQRVRVYVTERKPTSKAYYVSPFMPKNEFYM